MYENELYVEYLLPPTSRMTLSGSETEDIDMQHGFLPMYPPPHPAMLLPHG